MRWLLRVFASAAARRFAYIAVASILALAGIGQARAQDKTCRSDSDNCSVAEAQAACQSYPAGTGNTSIVGGATRRNCVFVSSSESSGFFVLQYWGKNSNGNETGPFSEGSFYWRNKCAFEPSKTTVFFPPNGSVRCVSGCEVVYRQNADDTTTYSPNGKVCDKKPDCAAQGKNMVWNAMLGVCQPVQPECPEGQIVLGNACADEKPCPDGMALVNNACKKEENECPAGMIRSPLGNCIPGDGQCAAGEVRGEDGTCKKDKDDDGEPDNDPDEPDSFSGGDTCDSPPSCSGSAIMCGQARIQWRIECNTRRNNNISGGQCTQAGMPVCTGEKCNAMEYTSLLMQWRSACAAEKLASKTDSATGGSESDKNGNGVADALEGVGEVTSPGDGNADVAASKKWGIGISTSMVDTSNMFGGGTCPQMPSFSIMGVSINGSDLPYFCQFAAILRGLILIFAAYWAMRILMGAAF